MSFISPDPGLMIPRLPFCSLPPKSHPCLLMALNQIKVQLPTVSLLLVELEEIPASQVHKDSGLLMEIRGTAVDLSTRTADMLLTVHLQSLTLEDRARPDDSPFRYESACGGGGREVTRKLDHQCGNGRVLFIHRTRPIQT